MLFNDSRDQKKDLACGGGGAAAKNKAGPLGLE